MSVSWSPPPCRHRRCTRARRAAIALLGLVYIAFAVVLISPSILVAAAGGAAMVGAAVAAAITCPPVADDDIEALIEATREEMK